MDKIRKAGSALVLALMLVLVASAAAPAGASAAVWKPGDPLIPNECFTKMGGCDWEDVVGLGQNLMYIVIYLTSLAAVISVTYAGWLYLTSQGSSSQISKAHEIFWKVATGIFFVLGAWLIVNTVISLLGIESGYSMLE